MGTGAAMAAVISLAAEAGFVPGIGHAAQGAYAAHVRAMSSPSACIQVERLQSVGHAAQGVYVTHVRARLKQQTASASVDGDVNYGRGIGHAVQVGYTIQARDKLRKLRVQVTEGTSPPGQLSKKAPRGSDSRRKERSVICSGVIREG